MSTDYTCEHPLASQSEHYTFFTCHPNIIIRIDDILEAAIWSCVETNVGFVCACIPTLKPLITKILPHLLFEINPVVKETPGFVEHMKGIHGNGKMPSHRAYAQFDIEGQVQEFEPGKVRVTTNIVQESDEGSIHDGSSDSSTKGLAF